MKAICVQKTLGLQVGTEYEVEQSAFHKEGYTIEGITPFAFLGHVITAFHKRAFAPLSDIDETKLDHAEILKSVITIKK